MGCHDLRQCLHFLTKERQGLEVATFFDGQFADRHTDDIGCEENPSFLVKEAVLGSLAIGPKEYPSEYAAD